MKAAGATLLLAALAGACSADDRRSGLEFMTPAAQALQKDDTQNPAALWLADGEERFATDCRRCHEPASMRGVAARHPAWDAALARGVTLGERINLCRTRHLKQPPWPRESDALLGVEAWIGRQSRGLPIAPDPRLGTLRDEGAALWRQRFGQLALACAECHEGLAGGRLGGAPIPQGHPTGYPIYRLEWQGMGSLQRRMRNCLAGVRAEPFADGAAEWRALEAFLMQRAAGMAVETPAVRP